MCASFILPGFSVNIGFPLLLCMLVLPDHHIFCPFESIKRRCAPGVGNISKDGAGWAGCLCPPRGSPIPETAQIRLFLLLKLYQHQQRNKARSLLLVQTPWTCYSVSARLPAGTFLPDRGLFDSPFSSSVWIGCGWGRGVCCQRRGTEYPVGSGSSALIATRLTWGREDGLVIVGGDVCLCEGSPIAPAGTPNLRGCGAPRGHRGKMLPWEEGRWGRQYSLWPQKAVWESEMCRACT